MGEMKSDTKVVTMSINVPVTFKMRVRKVGDEWEIVDAREQGGATLAVVRSSMTDEDLEHMEQLAEAAP